MKNNIVVKFIVSNIVSWVVEASILLFVAYITIAEVRKTSEMTRQMLTSISKFVGERKEAVGGAIDSAAKEVKNIKLGGKVDVGKAAEAALEKWKNRGKKQ